jgi:hypothetical protein
VVITPGLKGLQLLRFIMSWLRLFIVSQSDSYHHCKIIWRLFDLSAELCVNYHHKSLIVITNKNKCKHYADCVLISKKDGLSPAHSPSVGEDIAKTTVRLIRASLLPVCHDSYRQYKSIYNKKIIWAFMPFPKARLSVDRKADI